MDVNALCRHHTAGRDSRCWGGCSGERGKGLHPGAGLCGFESCSYSVLCNPGKILSPICASIFTHLKWDLQQCLPYIHRIAVRVQWAHLCKIIPNHSHTQRRKWDVSEKGAGGRLGQPGDWISRWLEQYNSGRRVRGWPRSFNQPRFPALDDVGFKYYVSILMCEKRT